MYYCVCIFLYFCFFKQKTAYEMRISDWSSDVCSSDLRGHERHQQAEQRPVDEDHLVLGVVGDVGELLREQADVEGVQHPPGAGGGEVELEVAGRVPRERGDPTVLGDAELVEHATEPVRPVGPGSVVGALAPGRCGRHELLVGEERLGAPHEVRQREWCVLHEPVHGGLLGSSSRCRAGNVAGGRRCCRYRDRSTAIRISETTTDRISEPMQPMRFEKKRNTPQALPLADRKSTRLNS